MVSTDLRARAVATATALRRGVTVAAMAVLVGFGGLGALDRTAPPAPPDALGLSSQADTALLAKHRCSATGFGKSATPPQALVRFDDGRTSVVSFDRGWKSFVGEAPGTVVALCLGDG